MNNELAKRPDLTPAELELLAQDTGGGLEAAPAPSGGGISSLILLQSLSPQIKITKEATNGDIGKIFHAGIKEIFDEVTVCLVDIIPAWVERLPQGKGNVGRLPDTQKEIVAAKKKSKDGRVFGKVQLKNGNEAVEVFHVFGFRLPATGQFDRLDPVVIKIKLTGCAPLSDITRRLSSAQNLGQGVVLDLYNFQLTVKSKDYTMRNGTDTLVLGFEGAVGDNLSDSRVPLVLEDGQENPVRVAGREFLRQLKENGQEEVTRMCTPPAALSDEDENDADVLG